MKKHSIPIFVSVIAFVALSIGSVGAVPQSHADSSTGAVYIMSNSPTGNQVIVYTRSADGSLTWSGNFATNGLGVSGLTGTNQGGLVLSTDSRWLLVANAGSNDVSVFRAIHNGLSLVDKEASGGVMPVSVTIHGNLVYVLNAGSSETAGNIAGFLLSDGMLSAIQGSDRPLSGAATVAQVSFNPTGTALAVTEKSTSLIDIYTVNSNGVATGPITNPSSGSTPFGFAFDNKGTLIVSEAAGGPSGTSAVSSYTISPTGQLTTITGSVPDSQLAACWIAVTGNGRFTYTANAHSGTISSYAISPTGSLTLLQEVAANTGAGDLDMSFTANSHFLYVFVHGSNSIQGYKVNADGTLELVTTVNGIPATADGLAAN